MQELWRMIPFFVTATPGLLSDPLVAPLIADCFLSANDMSRRWLSHTGKQWADDVRDTSWIGG